MASARIDLSNGAGWGNAIDRTKPAILNNYMSDYEWEAFCEEIDTAMKPVNKVMMISMGFFGLVCIAFIVSFIMVFARISDPYINSGHHPFVIFALPAAIILMCMLVFCYAAVVSTNARGVMQSVCASTSQRQPRLTFHVRYERSYSSYHSHHHHGSHTAQYIEVSIDHHHVTIPTGTDTEPDIVTGTGAVATATDRLTELEKARHLLSPAEYDAKRTEIVNQL